MKSVSALALSFVFLLMSCATSTSFQIASRRLPKGPLLAPVDPAAVQVLKQPPLRYVVVGLIRAELEGYLWREDLTHDPALAASARAEAARMGADAVIEIDVLEHQMGGGGPFFHPGGWMPRGSARRPTALIATAIRTVP